MGCASLKDGQPLSDTAASSYLHGVTLSRGRDLLHYKNNQPSMRAAEATLARLRLGSGFSAIHAGVLQQWLRRLSSPTLALIGLTLFRMCFIRNIFRNSLHPANRLASETDVGLSRNSWKTLKPNNNYTCQSDNKPSTVLTALA